MDQPAQAITEIAPTPPPVPANPQSPVVPKKSNKFPVFFLVVLVVGIVGVSAFWLGKSSSEPKVTTPTPTVVPAILEATPTADPTTGWKTLVSQNGFSIKYPSDWFVNSDRTDIISSLNNKVCDSVPDNQICVEIVVEGSSDPTRQIPMPENIQEYVNQKFGRFTNGVYETVPFEKVFFQGEDAGKLIKDGNYHFIIHKGNAFYWFRVTPSSSSLLGIFDQILSTFKFLP